MLINEAELLPPEELYSEEEIESMQNETYAQLVREQRDTLLTSSDWVTLKAQDTSSSVPQEWADYRQALRDITTQEGFPTLIEWPTKPE